MKKLLIVPIILSLSIYACGDEDAPTNVPEPTQQQSAPPQVAPAPIEISGKETPAPGEVATPVPVEISGVGSPVPVEEVVEKVVISGSASPIINSIPVLVEKPMALKKCIPCHTFEKGDPKKVGPNLFGIFGAETGKVPGFKYTEGFLSVFQGKVWNETMLDAWIENSKGIIKKTKMAVKVPIEEERTAIIGYLKSLQ